MTLGQYAMILIIGWQTYNLARDAGLSIAAASGQLALIGLLQFLPLFILTPFTGLAADKFDRSLSNFETGLVTNMTSMFEYALSFRGRGLQEWNTSSLQVMEAMFEGAISMDGTISDWEVRTMLATCWFPFLFPPD